MVNPPTTQHKLDKRKGQSDLVTGPIVVGENEIHGDFFKYHLSDGTGKVKDQNFVGNGNSGWLVLGACNEIAVMDGAAVSHCKSEQRLRGGFEDECL